MSELTDTELEAIRKRCEDGALVPDDIRQLLAEIDRLRAAHANLEKWVRDKIDESVERGHRGMTERRTAIIDNAAGRLAAYESVLSRMKGET